MKVNKLTYYLFALVLLVSSCVQDHYCEVKNIETDVQENIVSVHISAESSGDLIQYNWTFSDGVSKATVVPYTQHEFTSTGNHLVEVEVEDSEGNLCNYEAGFEIEDDFSRDTCDIDLESHIVVGNGVEAAVEVTGEDEGALFTWSTGDGFVIETEATEFYYEYSRIGSYDFMVTYEFGECIDSTVKVVHLDETNFEDCGSEIAFQAKSIITDKNVTFQSAVTDPNWDVKYIWDMGDGSPISYSYGPNFNHDYTEFGTYTVLVRLEDGDCWREEILELIVN